MCIAFAQINLLTSENRLQLLKAKWDSFSTKNFTINLVACEFVSIHFIVKMLTKCKISLHGSHMLPMIGKSLSVTIQGENSQRFYS